MSNTKNRDMITKSEFVGRYADINGVTKKQAGIEVENFLTALYKTLIVGDGVQFPGFGAFGLSYNKPRITKMQFGEHAGEIKATPARYRVVFYPSQAMRSDTRSLPIDE